MEREGLVTSYESNEASDIRGGRPRQYYKLTAKGAGEATMQRESVLALLATSGVGT